MPPNDVFIYISLDGVVYADTRDCFHLALKLPWNMLKHQVVVGEYRLIHQFVLSSLYPFSFIEGENCLVSYTAIFLGPPFQLISLIFCYANIDVLWKPLDLYTICIVYFLILGI